MRGYLSFSVQWNFWPWVSFWLLFPRWYVAISSSGPPLSTSVFQCISRIDGIRCHLLYIGGICPSLYHSSILLVFYISIRNHAVRLPPFIVQHNVYTSLPQQRFKSPYIDNIFFSLISAIHFCLWINALLKWVMWHTVFISVCLALSYIAQRTKYLNKCFLQEILTFFRRIWIKPFLLHIVPSDSKRYGKRPGCALARSCAWGQRS